MAVCIPTYMLAAGLVAGGMSWWQAVCTIIARQRHRARADDAQRPRGHEVRHPVPGARARVVRPRRRARAGAAARAGRLRLVRHPDLDRRRRARYAPRHRRCRSGTRCRRTSGSASVSFWALNIFFIVKGTESIRFFEIVGGAVAAPHGRRAARLGDRPRRRRRADLLAAVPLRDPRRVLAFFIPSLTAMIGFWATLSLNIPDFTRYAEDAARADRRPGDRVAADDGAVLVHRGGGDVGQRADLRGGDLGSGRAARTVRQPDRRAAVGVRAGRRDAHDQHRGQRRAARQRLRQPAAAEDLVRHRRADHRR